MLNIQHIFDIIETYRLNKGFFKKIFHIDHPAISATKTYLKSLKKDMNVDHLSITNLLVINRFFCYDFPIKSKQVVFNVWILINY